MALQQPGDLIGVDPDLGVALLLPLLEDELDAEVEVDRLDVVDVLGVGVAGAAHEADDLPGLHPVALLQPRGVGCILPQMRIVIIPFPVVGADANPPAAVLVPAQGLHGARLHGDDGRAEAAHHVVTQMAAAEAVAPGGPEIVAVGVPVAGGDGREGFDSPGRLPFAVDLHRVVARETAEYRCVGLEVILIVTVVAAQDLLRRFPGRQAAAGRRHVGRLRISAALRGCQGQNLNPGLGIVLLPGLLLQAEGPLHGLAGEVKVDPLDRGLRRHRQQREAEQRHPNTFHTKTAFPRQDIPENDGLYFFSAMWYAVLGMQPEVDTVFCEMQQEFGGSCPRAPVRWEHHKRRYAT